MASLGLYKNGKFNIAAKLVSDNNDIGKISLLRYSSDVEIIKDRIDIEKIATGIRRIKSYYREYDSKPEFQITDNSVRVVLPNVLYKKEITLSGREKEVIILFMNKEFLAAKDISESLGIKKTQTIKYLKSLVSKGLLDKIGSSRNIKYVLK